MSEYETDIARWSERQAALLWRRAAGELVNDDEVDWPNIAEEIESVGRSERAALASHVGTVIEHLLKLEASPAVDPRAGWKETVLRTRAAIDESLEASPSLRSAIDTMITRALVQRRRLVAEVLALYDETPRVTLDTIAYSAEQVLGPWFPDDGN
jgi:hypothetical protein